MNLLIHDSTLRNVTLFPLQENIWVKWGSLLQTQQIILAVNGFSATMSIM